MAIVGIADNCVSFFCFWLFYNRMKILMKNVSDIITIQKTQGNNDPEILTSQLETMYIVRKCAILFGFLQVTTWIALGLIVLTPMLYLWTAIDSVINTWSSILHDKRYDRVYLCLCQCIAKTNKMKEMLVAEQIGHEKEMAATTSGHMMESAMRVKSLSTPTVTVTGPTEENTNSVMDFDGSQPSNVN